MPRAALGIIEQEKENLMINESSYNSEKELQDWENYLTDFSQKINKKIADQKPSLLKNIFLCRNVSAT